MLVVEQVLLSLVYASQSMVQRITIVDANVVQNGYRKR
jgi:hypothetical protein